MAKEIERKFLVNGDAYRDDATARVRMLQGYLADTAHCSVRVRLEGEQARISVKSAGLDIERDEFEYPIPVADAEGMLERLCEGGRVAKTRYLVPFRGMTWEVDEFHGDNQGLVVAEVELEDRHQQFDLPPWIDREVSGDPRYLNTNLAKRPFRQW